MSPSEMSEARRRRFEPLPAGIGPSTRAVHSARRAELNAGAVVPPIYQTSTFHFPAPASEARGHGDVHLYTRHSNPTQEVAAEIVRELEGAGAARVFGSGMGAIGTTVLAMCRTGDSVVAASGLYGGTEQLLSGLLPRYGVHVRFLGEPETTDVDAAVPAGTRLVFLESPTNPLLHVHDIAEWARRADAVGALLVVDNTFATPINQRPLDLGADLVVHSATKYLGGHSDLLAGVVAGPSGLISRIERDQIVLGSVLDPFAAFLLTRGMRTLALRVARHNDNGRRVAEAMARRPEVARVHYPGLASPREEAVAARQMRGRGGMVCLSLAGGLPAARRFIGRLRLAHVATSLGGVETLVSLPVETSHRHLSPAERQASGIDDSLVRLSLGIEEPEDLVGDVTQALAAAQGPGAERSL